MKKLTARTAFGILALVHFQSLEAAEDPRVTTARRVLAEFQTDAPRNDRKLHVAYFCPSDREPAPQFQDRLDRMLADISQFYSTQLRQHGFPCEGIPLAKDAAGKLIIHQVKGTKPASEYSEAKSAHEIRRDVEQVLAPQGIGLASNHVIVFTRLGNFDGTNSWHNSPYAGMGDVRAGFCWQFDSDILDTRLLENTNLRTRDRQYGNINLGKYNSIFIGGTAHELGHLFGLPHNATTRANLETFGHSLMGDGNRHYGEERRNAGKGSFLPLADALRLVSNPVFSRVDKGRTERPDGTISNTTFDTVTPGRLKITGHYNSSTPVYGIVAYANPNVQDDHDAVAYAGTLTPDGTFSIELDNIPHPHKAKTADLRILLLYASGTHLSAYAGAHAPFRQHYTIAEDGRIVVGTPQNR